MNNGRTSKTSAKKILWVGRKRKVILFALVFGLIGSILLYSSFADTPGGSEPAHGLIIQVSTLSPTITPAKLKSWLDQIYQQNNISSKSTNGKIDSIVLQDIADTNGNLLTDYLDVIAPYLPGGATATFTKAYVGTVDINWGASGSKYIEGVENPTFRSTNVSMSKSVATAFYNKYGYVNADWYITYEANLSGFWDKNIESGYLTYINNLIPILSAIRSGKQYMWSPAFWSSYDKEPTWALPDLKSNLNDLFSKTSKPLTLDLQDFVGQSGGATTQEDASKWINYLSSNWQSRLSAIMINSEQFSQRTDGSIIPADNVEVNARQNYYIQQGIKLGPSWEIRYWHQRIFGS